jgi:DNA-binding PadR family transcriptional regulator
MSIISLPKKRILEELKQNTSHGYVLSQKLNLPLSSIYEHIKELREAKLIDIEEKERRKIYRLTEKGEMLLKALE